MRIGSILNHYANTILSETEVGSIALKEVLGEKGAEQYKDYTGDQLKAYLVEMFTPSAVMKFEVGVDELLLSRLS